MASYDFRLLGQPVLSGPGMPPLAPKATALLAYLASFPGEMQPRSQIAWVFWPECDEAAGRHNLSSLLTRMRSRMSVWPLMSNPESVGWDLASGVALDLVQFMALSGGPWDDLCSASALWRGPFCDGLMIGAGEEFDEWLTQERQIWERRILSVRGRLVELSLGEGRWETALHEAALALALDPLQERFHRAIMEAHHGLGDRAAALAQYQQCQRLLRAELAASPDEATVMLAQAIAQGTLRRSAPFKRPQLAVHHGQGEHQNRSSAATVVREAEHQRLRQLMVQAAQGARQTMVIQGEAGSGKSHLVAALLADLEQSPGHTERTVLVGHCYETTQGLAYAPFVAMLAPVVADGTWSSLGLPDVWLAEVSRLFPQIAADRPDLSSPITGNPGEDQHRLFQAVAHLLMVLPTPILAVLEDLQWADTSSQALFAYLAQRTDLAGITLIATVRSHEQSAETQRLLDALQGLGGVAWLGLEPLDEEATALLVRSVLGHDDPALERQIYRETRGNSLFTVELLRSLKENGDLDRPDLTLGEGLPLPATVQTTIRARLARLPKTAVDLLSAASLSPLGMQFQHLCAVCGMAEGDAVSAVDLLLRANLLQEEDGCLTFGHEIIRRVAYDQLTPFRRRHLHGRAYESLIEALNHEGQKVSPSDLARHGLAAQRWESALEWSLLAADEAERLFAIPLVHRHLESALACLNHLPETLPRRRLRIDIRLRQAHIAQWSEPLRQHQWLESAASLAVELNDKQRISEIHMGQAGAWIVQGLADKAAPFVERMLRLARKTQSRSMLGAALALGGVLASLRNDYDGCIALYHEAVPLLPYAHGGTQLAIFTHASAVGVLSVRGKFAEAAVAVQAFTAAVMEHGDPALTGMVLGGQASVAFYQRRWEEAASLSQQGIRVSQEAGHRFSEYYASIWLGPSLVRLGELRAAENAFNLAVRLSREVGSFVLLDQVYGRLGEALLRLGDLPGAVAAAQEGLALAQSQRSPHGRGVCLCTQGLIAKAQGDHHGAVACLVDAAEQFRSVGADPDLADCYLLLAEMALTAAERQRYADQAASLLRRLGR